MAFPADYIENTTNCPLVPDTRWDRSHNWATTGHPVSHRCQNCHERRWQPKPKPTKATKSSIDLHQYPTFHGR